MKTPPPLASRLVLQALGTATTAAAQTRNMKLARDLGLLTLGRISAGLYQEEIRDRFFGTFGEEGYPEFEFEVALGLLRLRRAALLSQLGVAAVIDPASIVQQFE